MQHRIIKQGLSATLLAGLIGFSSLGFAQSEAIGALNAAENTTDTAAISNGEFAQANELARELDAYNDQATANTGLDHPQAPESAAPVTAEARTLSRELDAYNERATAYRVPDTHMPAQADTNSASATSQTLAAQLSRYNESGGSLSSLEF